MFSTLTYLYCENICLLFQLSATGVVEASLAMRGKILWIITELMIVAGSWKRQSAAVFTSLGRNRSQA